MTFLSQTPASSVSALLKAIAALSADGLVVKTGANTAASRTIEGVAGEISIVNGNGVLGNPTVGIGANVVTLAGAQTLTNKTLTSPTIANFVNAGHTHQNAAGGGTLDASAIAAGVLANARINWAAPGAIGSTTPAAGTFNALGASVSDTSVGTVLRPLVVTRSTSNTPIAGIGSGIELRANYSAGNVGALAYIDALTTALSQTAALVFSTANGGAPAERMRLTAAGNFGLGTNSPTTRLHVVGATGTDSSSQILLQDQTGNATNKSARVNLAHYTNVEQEIPMLQAVSTSTDTFVSLGGGIGALNAATVIRFYTAPNNITLDGTERMRITSAGLVGVGTSSPTELLDINSDAIRIRTPQTPASATAAGNQGDICWDSGFIYVCIAANTWRRATLAVW